MTTNRYYTRFVPREELGQVTRWEFGAVDGAASVLGPLIAEPAVLEPEPQEAAPPPPVVVPLDEHEALLQQAHAQGHADGLREGQEGERLQWQQRMDEYVSGQGSEAAARLAQLAQSFESSLAGLQQDMAQQVLALACDIARQVVRSEVNLNRQAVLPVVREALGMLAGESRPATVRLHPQDWQALEPALRAEHPSPRIEWLPDAGVQPGGCLVESAGMAIDGTLDKRWSRAIAALGLTDAWREAPHGD